MIRSMTGYGEAEREAAGGRLRVEIKTVNHRFFNAHLRVPAGFDRHEPEIRRWLQGWFPRGHVVYTLTLSPEPGGPLGAGPVLDEALARRYRDLLTRLKEVLGLPGEVDLTLLAGFRELFRPPEEEAGTLLELDEVRRVSEEAARAALALRREEGRRLETHLRESLARMAEELERIEARAPERLAAERDRLREAVRELAGSGEVDEDRLAREVAYLAERWDIQEELVRLRSHLHLFREALDREEGAVGKRLGFLAQEMLREANTIAAKANDREIAHRVVALKEEIERIREQVENVE